MTQDVKELTSSQSPSRPSPVRSNMAEKTETKNEDLTKFKTELQKHLEKQLIKGDTWYLIDNHWLKQCKKYVGFEGTMYDSGGVEAGDESANPGPIDNKTLFKDDNSGDIREHMIDELDYVLVAEEGWNMLVERFHLEQGQEAIARKVVEHGMFVKHCKVEVYYIEFQLAENSDLETVVKKKFSKSDTLEHIEKLMRTEFSINEGVETRLWNKYTSNTYEQLARLDNTVQDAGLFSGQLIIIEQKNEDGTWPRQARSTNSIGTGATSPIPAPPAPAGSIQLDKKEDSPGAGTSSGAAISTRYNFGSYSDGGVSDKAKPGICGLSNLGNTCFMNSIIQGLSNTPEVTEYFDCDNYIEDINEDNPLGMKGEIARAFGQMVKDMWSGKFSYVVPRAFKMAVGRFAPQFSGYQQQDSQELLTFLLDGLHEDLNRVKQKPYVEMSDSDNRTDEEVATEAWSNYKKRNDSVILDIFHGLLKSTVVCPECPKVSVTFDPFCYLSLPLPVKKERQVEVFLVYLDPSRSPRQFKVTVHKSGSMSDLCQALGKLAEVDSSRLMVTDVYNHRFHKIYTNDDQLSHILDRDDIFIYETPSGGSDDSAITVVPVYLREKKSSSTYAPSNLFGQPLLVGVPSEANYETLYNILLNRMSRYVTRPDDSEEWWKPPPATVTEVEMNGSPEVQSDSQESPVSEGDPQVQDDEMLSDEEESGPPRLFNVHIVNSYGNAQVDSLQDDGQPLKLQNKHYLALDWHPRAKSQFFNDKAAEDFSQDDSYHGKVVPKKQGVVELKEETGPKVIKLQECLSLYTTEEKLGAEDTWYCPNCKSHQQATKKFDLWCLPEVLVIHLKRFSYNRYWRDKIDTLIEFPVKGLDMTNYVINEKHGVAMYDLIAVSNHYGGMGGGHYTAYGKNKDDGLWYYFDDSSVTISNEEAVVTKAAYVLFYQRRKGSSKAAPRRNIPASTETSNNLCNGHNGHNGRQDSDEDMEVN